MRSSSGEASIIGFGTSELSIGSVFLLAIVVAKEVAMTVTSFLTVLDNSLSNGLF